MTNQVKVGIGVVVVLPNREIVLLKRKGSHGSGEWSFPGGHLEYNESIIDCAVREVKEELNVDIDKTSAQILPVITEDFFPDDNKHYITLYVLTHTTDLPTINEPDKASDILTINTNDSNLPNPLFSGVLNVWKYIQNRI